MTIHVTKVAENLYNVSATPPRYIGGKGWSSSEPLDGKRLVEELMRRGFHIQDICDAIAEEDASWVQKMKDAQRE